MNADGNGFFPTEWTRAEALNDAGYRVPISEARPGSCREYKGYWICVELVEDDPEDDQWSNWWWIVQSPGSKVDSYSGEYDGSVADGSISMPEMAEMVAASDYTLSPHAIARRVAVDAVDRMTSPKGKRSRANPVRLRGPSEVRAYCEEIVRRYDALPSEQPEERWRWELLGKHVEKMYRQILKRIDVQFVKGQPYVDAQQMRDEVQRTGVLYISTDANEHPVFSGDLNLKFRAVHDYVVHIAPGKPGPDFTERGELRAYNLHRRLAPRDSWPALFTEVAAQACYANVAGRFPPQKASIFDGVDFYNVGVFDTSTHLAAKRLKAKLLR